MGFECFTLLLYSTILLAPLQISGQKLPSTFPHIYPGIPNTKGNFSDSAAWQNYFHVQDELPNVTFPLARSFAGNIPVNRKTLNNTLFFWAFERTPGSLTTESNCEDPWVIWLSGGPGISSMTGLLVQNGPIHFNPDSTAFSNNYSWSGAVDTFWIDQPVGTGWSTCDADAFVVDEDEMAHDFFGFLSNLVQVFPSLAKRPLYLNGASYAGVYIPYITKTYFSLPNPPVSLRKIAIGNGLYNLAESSFDVTVVSILETYPQLIGYDTDVLTYFKEQSHLCGFEVNLTYPQNGLIPTIKPPAPAGPASKGPGVVRGILNALLRDTGSSGLVKRGLTLRHTEESRAVWKRDLAGRPNKTIDPWYGCDLYIEMVDYALNFSVPWKGSDENGFDIYNIPDALDPESPPTTQSVGVFLNDPRAVAAIHAPISKTWIGVFTPDLGYPFKGGNGDQGTIRPMDFFSELASNLSAHDMQWILYSGNADTLVAHFGTEIVIQNTTFGGIQGFTQKPSTPWYDEEGNFAGKVHQERNLTYAVFVGAGHDVPVQKPIAALTFLKEFILSNNPLGTVLANGTVIGGTNASLSEEILPAVHDPILVGSGTTQGSYNYPSATVAAWNRFTASADVSATAV